MTNTEFGILQTANDRDFRPSQLAYSVAEAARATGLGKTTIYGLIGAGDLPSRKIGRRRLIAACDLKALIVGGKSHD